MTGDGAITPSAMGLQSRLLAGLGVLVCVAVASTGWMTLEVARGGLEAAEAERARALGTAVAGLLGAVPPGDDEAFRRAAQALAGVGGIRDVSAIDAHRRVLAGSPDGDGRLVAALGGETWIERSHGGGQGDGDGEGMVAVYAPIRGSEGPGGGAARALRLRLAVGANLGEAARRSSRLLLTLTLVDAALIVLFGSLFVRQVVRPLGALRRAALRVAEGDLATPSLPAAPGEVGTLIDSFNRMTTALAEQQRHLEASREQVLAQEKLATVGRLAAGIAHEIGNPLTAVLGYVDLLLAEERDAAARDLLGRVKAETGRIHRIVHDLLDYARPARDALEPVRWSDVLAAAEALLRPQRRFRDVAVHHQLPASLPPVAGSTRRLLQVLLNLLLNAADATGGAGEVWVRGWMERERVILEVEDSGPGVPPDARARLFDPFFTTKDPGAGTGLGLAVCRSIVIALGGTIELRASDERGAAFRVTLPPFARR